MFVYAILLPSDASPVADEIQRLFPNDHHRINAAQWLVASSSTTQEVGAQLGIWDARNPAMIRKGDGIVLAVSNYTGVANRDVWEWLKSRMEGPRG